MCRLLLITSKQVKTIVPHLQAFARIAETSEQWQGDGWGIAYRDRSGKISIYKSLQPIWKDQKIFSIFPPTNFALVHARGAYKQPNLDIRNNHPFQSGKWLFAFNGYIQGVTIKIPGSTGAKKIFNLLLKNLKLLPPKRAIAKTVEQIEKNSQHIVAMNFILTDAKKAYVYCCYSENENYFALRYYKGLDVTIICSQEYDYSFVKMQNRELQLLS